MKYLRIEFLHKTWHCMFLVAWFSTQSSGQILIPCEQILATARLDPTLNDQGQPMDDLLQNKRSLPFVDEISLRTETDRFLFTRQEYLARVSVNGFHEIAQQRMLNNAQYATNSGNTRVYVHETLMQRYQAIADYRYILQKLARHGELELVYQDKVNVLTKMAALNADGDLDELIKTEYDLDDLSLKKTEAQATLERLQYAFIQLIPGTAEGWLLDTSDFITVDRMEVLVAEFQDSVFQNPKIAEKQARIGQYTAAYNLEKAKSNQMLDFFQVRYASIPFAPIERELSFGIAFTLPFKGSSSVNMTNLLIDKNYAALNLQRFENELTTEINNARLQTRALGQRYRLAQKQWQDSQARYTLEKSGVLLSEGPLTILRARELQIKRELNLLEIERDMQEQYLTILDLTGLLSVVPSINYLSSGLETY